MDQDWTNLISILICGGIGLVICLYLDRYWDSILYKIRSWGFEYEYQVEMVSALIPFFILIILLFPVVGVMMGNVPGWVGLVVLMCYPLVVMILRPVAFKNVKKAYTDNYFWVIFLGCSWLAGGYFTGAGFSMFNFDRFPWELAVIKLSVGIIGQTIPLLPDYIEKISRLDLGIKRQERMTTNETLRVLIFMLGLSAVIFLILQNVVMQYIQIDIFGI